MKHKIGDKVRVRSKEWWDAQPKDEDAAVKCGSQYFTLEMTRYCGESLTIEEIVGDYYFVEEDGYNWTDKMFEDEALNISGIILQDIANVIKSHNLGISISAQDGKLIIEPLDDEEDLAVDTPCMVADELDDWHLRYYAGNKRCFVYSQKSNDTDDTNKWACIIPCDKFNFVNPKESLKYNLVK